ncbi:NAD-dependent epimerase/dehydratase family protein [Streptomyces sp. A1277]|uniref:NmrA family NAD(P)-binding protein n=1 Tax=Streptomyces sp. A1277 TaxID=2563103 RepID=UPI0010A259C9|nr:NAD(P)H-binding protein [Streptomyces sp. A1277]THA29653.1 NAD-dependent epimerase/dehydratase family protein [Streptomyces sp. A1277]
MIVLTAPTGRIGHQVLDALLDDGRHVRVIARDPARLTPRARQGAEIVQGSHSDPQVLAEAFKGADSVLWLVPPNPVAGDVREHYLGFTRPACEAVRAQGVRRVVGVSSLGRAYGPGAGQLSAAFAMDEMIESTGAGYRALAMPFFMENLLHQAEALTTQGVLSLPVAADRPLPLVATRDIAATAARLLADDSWSGQATVPVVGPDSLSPEDMARVLSEVLGRPVRFEQLDRAAYKAAMVRYGMSEAWAQGLFDMADAQDNGVYDGEWRALTTPAPTGFRQWCREVLIPAAGATAA